MCCICDKILTMESSEITLSKTLHYMVEQFISSIKSCFDPEVLELRRIFCEIIKRSDLIIQDLRSIATYANTTSETSDVLDVKDQVDKRIQELVHNLLQQDFVELILSTNDDQFDITESELHNFLHSGAMTDVSSFSPVPLNLGLPFYFLSSLSESMEITDIHTVNRSLNCSLSSSQFENSRVQFEDEVKDLRRIMKNGFSTSDLNMFNVASILKHENTDIVEKTDTCVHKPGLLEPKNIIQPVNFSPDFNFGICDDDDDSDDFLSWEGCLGNFLPDHLFISEVTSEVALLNISEKESQSYYHLLNSSDAISEDDMVHDILDLLTGIASDTFYYDIHTRKFRIKSLVHLPKLSPECTAKSVSKFIESGSIYYLLYNFSSDVLHSSKGLVFKGLQLGIQQVLTVYKEYIAAVKVKSPNLLSLRMDVEKNAEMMQMFGAICGLDSEKMVFKEIPKGLSLLSYLHRVAQCRRKRENEIMIAVLLKYTYAAYFSFLNKWLTEGICDDFYDEFQIMEDFNYLGRRDTMYWKFAYTENIEDPTRAIPPEIKSYAQGILDCGKSINLLKICCPNLFCLKFLFCKPPPPLSMVFSLPAVISKLRESLEYINLKEKAEEAYNIESAETSVDSVDRFYVECQKFVNKEVMMGTVQRRYNILCAAADAKSNICCSSQMKQYFKDFKSFKYMQEDIKISYIKWRSLCSLVTEGSNRDPNFSGMLYGNIGLLFSSCGYNKTNLKCGSEVIQIEFTSLDFSKQLDLISYTQVFADNLMNLTKHKKLFSVPEMEILNSIYVDPYSKWNSCNVRIIKKNSSYKQDGSSKCSYSRACCKKVEEKEQLITEKSNCARSFIEKLASLLISEYGDSIEDIYTCIQVTSLQHLIPHNFNAVLNMRIHLVERTIMKYIVKQLGLDSLLYNLRNLYFLQDGLFSQSLCEQLFSLVMKCKTPRTFANWAVLSEMLQQAISDSDQENNSFLSSVNVNVISVPDEMPPDRTEVLHLFKLEYEVNWPLNVIVHQTCMQQYLKIHSTLLEIEFLCWLLCCIWRILIVTSKELHLDDSPQFRDVMLKRFDMEQFIRVIRNSIHQHLQGPLWEFLQKSLSVEESSIDGLESIHLQYLEKALARCFLTSETHVLHELLSVMLRQIYKFSSTVYECTWKKNCITGHYDTFEYQRLSSCFATFKQYQKVFLKRILKETLTKKFGRHWDKDYRDFLDTILETQKNIV